MKVEITKFFSNEGSRNEVRMRVVDFFADYLSSGAKYRNYPKHDDIGDELIKKRAENLEMYKRLYDLLRKVYECHDVEMVEYADMEFSMGCR